MTRTPTRRTPALDWTEHGARAWRAETDLYAFEIVNKGDASTARYAVRHYVRPDGTEFELGTPTTLDAAKRLADGWHEQRVKGRRPTS